MLKVERGVVEGRHGAGASMRPGLGEQHTPQRGEHHHYRPDIDGLRAIAVLGVLAFHAFPAALKGGFVGVDIFFVISGYVIASAMLREAQAGQFSFLRFYGRRIKRLAPALVIVLTCCYAFGWFNLLPDEFQALGKHMAGAAASVVNLVLWKESGYFDTAAAQKPLLHLWSLGVEEQFYLLLPFLILGANRLRSPVVAWLAGCCILSFVANALIVHSDAVSAFYLPLTRAWEPLFGALLALWHLRTHRITGAPRIALAKATLGAAAIAASFLCLTNALAFPGWWALIPALATCLIIDAGRSTNAASQILAGRWLVAIGLMSYPLYLYHWPLLSFGRLLNNSDPGWVWKTLAIGICFPLAWLTYRYVESPIRRTKRTTLAVSGLAFLVLLLGAIGYDTYHRDGLEFRMSKIVSGFVDGAHFDRDNIWRRGTCYLEGADSTFASTCVDAGKQPLVALWGDSRAAALYPGIRSASSAYPVRLAQFSASGCPPVLDGPATDRCTRISQLALDAVVQAKPQVVLLTANWTTERLQTLAKTVQALRGAGVPRIVLIGQVATWQSGLPKLYWLYWRKNHQELPAHTRFGLDTQSGELDREGRAVATRLGIEYVSAFDAMCEASGCLTRAGAGRGSIAMFDDSHLTPQGADAVARPLAPLLFKH